MTSGLFEISNRKKNRSVLMQSEPGSTGLTRRLFNAPFVTRVCFARTGPWFARKHDAIDQASFAAIDSIKDTS